ncbi:MAG: DegT/DnrJ/EryC1/StrS family aminotransferase [Chloroflexota bacterium]|nr:DegT/DnrJ/EryC1/StrS family aminotransferase [Chloroflexota bacterium]
MNIPFMRLDRQFEQNKDEILTLCEQVFSHGRVLQGPEVESLEHHLSIVMNARYAVAVGSGTDALFFTLIAAGMKPGDRVAVPAMTFIATASPILRAGGTPVFVDAGNDYQPDITHTIHLVETGLVNIVVTAHLYGQLFDITPLADACQSNDVLLIEDAAQAIGSTLNGSKPASQSNAAIVSFDPMKIAGAFGSGGAVITNNPDIATRVKRLRYHGRDESRAYQELGYNSQIASIQAAIVKFKLDHLKEWTKKRQQIAQQYTTALEKIPDMTAPRELPGSNHVFHKYVLNSGPERNCLREHLALAGIETMIHYPSSLNKEPIFSKYVEPESSFPEAERISKEALSLPIYPELTNAEVNYVCESITNFNTK